jgi:uncharacterized protein YgiB involved in biofilm formation
MKRSKMLKLIVLGSAPLLLAGCEEEREAVVYESAQACIAAAQVPAEVCQQDYQKAQDVHDATAPRYSSAADCETDFGSNQCYRSSFSGNSFVPIMTGYMIASLVHGNSSWYGASNAHTSQPLYRTRDSGTWRTASDYKVSDRSGSVRVPASAAQPATRAVTMSRSGFGSTASARGGWGGGG